MICHLPVLCDIFLMLLMFILSIRKSVQLFQNASRLLGVLTQLSMIHWKHKHTRHLGPSDIFFFLRPYQLSLSAGELHKTLSNSCQSKVNSTGRSFRFYHFHKTSKLDKGTVDTSQIRCFMALFKTVLVLMNIHNKLHDANDGNQLKHVCSWDSHSNVKSKQIPERMFRNWDFQLEICLFL